MKYNVGLTGLIGSGKSLVSQYFRELQVNVIDTDEIAHLLSAPNAVAILPIINEFGREFITTEGALNRAKMRNLIYNNANAKLKLEAIIHPLILDQVNQEIDKSTTTYNVIVVPLLFNSKKYLNLIDRSLFVDCEIDTLIERVVLRNGLSSAEVEQIISHQMPRLQQLLLANDVIYNDSDLDNLYQQVVKFNLIYKKLAKEKIF